MDTVESITKAIQTLQGFKQLIRDRADHRREEKGLLQDWLVLGRWQLGQFGQVGTCTASYDSRIPAEAFPDLPPVLTIDNFWELVKAKNLPDEYSLCIAAKSEIPPARCKCPVCGQGWTMANVHDCRSESGDRTMKLDGYVGKTIGQLQVEHDEHTEGAYLFALDLAIRNDRFIDLTPDPWWLEKYNENHPKNHRGWKRRNEGFGDDYIIQPGDEIHYWFFEYIHTACMRQRIIEGARNLYVRSFTDAGIAVLSHTQIPNEYCDCERCAPWWIISTPIGDFKLGRRKRVYNLDWSATGGDYLSLFGEEDVTKGDGYIHCWGIEKVTEYLKKIKEHYESKACQSKT